MHTLSIFPSLLTFGIFAPFLLRLVVSYFLINLGKNIYRNESTKWLAFGLYLVSAMLIVGLYTQLVVLAGVVMIKLNWWIKRKISPISDEAMMLNVLAGIILLSLIFTGPGLFAIDYPL